MGEGEGWVRLGRAITRSRVDLGIPTITEFARLLGLSTRIVGDLEAGRRDSYDPATLAKVERTLNWPTGHLNSLLAGDPEDELSTPEGIARYLHRDDLPLVVLLHRAGLPRHVLFQLILRVRAVRERQNAELLGEVAALIREAGGWAPEQPYPPTWLLEENPDER